MAKSEIVPVNTKQVVANVDEAKTFLVGGVEYKVVNRVNLPTLKHETGEVIAIRIDAPIREEMTTINEEVIIQGVKQTISKENTINVVRVTELNSMSPFEYVCNAMTADNLRSAYPDNGYVGLEFAILKGDTAPGKRYKETTIVQIGA